jgi:transposase-like protein
MNLFSTTVGSDVVNMNQLNHFIKEIVKEEVEKQLKIEKKRWLSNNLMSNDTGVPVFDMDEIGPYIQDLSKKGLTVRQIQGHFFKRYKLEISEYKIINNHTEIKAQYNKWIKTFNSHEFNIIWIERFTLLSGEDGSEKEYYVAIGLCNRGFKHFLGVGELSDRNSILPILWDLKRKGVKRLRLVSSPFFNDIEDNLQIQFPEAKWVLNIPYEQSRVLGQISSQYRKQFERGLNKIYRAPKTADAIKQLIVMEKEWQKHYPLLFQELKLQIRQLKEYYALPEYIKQQVFSGSLNRKFYIRFGQITKGLCQFDKINDLSLIYFVGLKDITDRWSRRKVYNWNHLKEKFDSIPIKQLSTDQQLSKAS